MHLLGDTEGIKCGLITVLGSDFDEQYLAAVLATAINPNAVREVAEDLKVVYTPIHGAGARLVPEVFRRMGLKYLYTVDAQMTPDGNFPTVAKPNPEYAAVFSLGIETANEVGSDLVIATDPDADRVGVMAKGKDGEFHCLTGNQMANWIVNTFGAVNEAGLNPTGYQAVLYVTAALYIAALLLSVVFVRPVSTDQKSA